MSFAPTYQSRFAPHLSGRLLLALFGILVFWHALAGLLPVTHDEAYYFDWSRHLAWGYFDHPPAVALLGLGVRLLPGAEGIARIGAVLASALTLWALFAWYRRSGLSGYTLLIALVLAATNFPLLVYGFVDNPDVPLLLCWALAMHEATVALQGRRRRWLSTGLAVGLGLLSKYTMVLILPVLFWGLIRGDARALRTPWPWLGLLLSMLLLLPNLRWNFDHGGGSMLYQLEHGFGMAHEFAMPGPIDGVELALPRGARAVAPAPTHPGVAGIAAYAGSQLAMFGGLLLALVIWLAGRLRPHRARLPAEAKASVALAPGPKALLFAGALVPLAFFAVFAAYSKVQANWPAPWLLSASPLAALVLRKHLRWVLAGATLNLLLLSLVLVHAKTGVLPLKPDKDRILRETHGYRALAEQMTRLPGPLFTDRYQLTAMLRFYQPSLAVTQWPGIHRSSEYLRGQLVAYPTLAQIRARGGFWLLTRDSRPPPINGFSPQRDRTLFDCKDGSVSTTVCASPVHRWFLYRYRDL